MGYNSTMGVKNLRGHIENGHGVCVSRILSVQFSQGIAQVGAFAYNIHALGVTVVGCLTSE